MKKVVAVYDTDAAYAIRFTEYINRKKDFEFDVYGFTKLENLKEYIISNPVEILLLGGNIDAEELFKEKIKYIIRLSDYSKQLTTSSYPEIYKYQSMHSILSELISYYANQNNDLKKFHYDTNTKFISVFSPVIGGSKQIFAWSMALNFSQKVKTLFISLELCPIEYISKVKDSKYGVSEFIYYLKDDNPNLIMVMKSLLQDYGKLSFLSGVSHGFDLMSITKEDMAKWIEQIRLYTDYQVVIFYVGFYNEIMMDLLQQCETIYIIKEKNSYELAVEKEWERQMAYIGMTVDEEKFIKIDLPHIGSTLNAEFNLENISQSSIWEIAKEQVVILLGGGCDGSIEG